MKQILSWILAVILVLSAFALAEEDQNVIALVNGEAITYDDMAAEYEYNLNYYASYGITDEESLSQLRAAIVDAYVQNKVMEQKVAELGLPVASPEDIHAQALGEYEETIFTLMNQYGANLYTGEGDVSGALAAFTEYFAAQEGAGLMDAIESFSKEDEANGAVLNELMTDVNAFLDANDYSLAAVEAYYGQTARTDAVNEYIAGMVDVSDESVKAYFDKMVAADQEEFTESPENVEYYVASGYGMPLFIPEGYRYIKHILVLMDSEDQNAMYSANTEAASAQAVVDELSGTEPMTEEDYTAAAAKAQAIDDRLAEIETLLAAEDADIDALTAEQEALNNEKAAVEETLSSDAARLYQAASSLAMAQAAIDGLKAKYQPQIDDIYARLANGEDFTSLVLELGQDPGMLDESGENVTPYLVYENTAGLWEESFAAAATALEEGQYTQEAVWTSYGAHIILYESSVPVGPVDFETVRESITDEYVQTTQQEKYTELMDEWTGSAQIQTWPERLVRSEETEGNEE